MEMITVETIQILELPALWSYRGEQTHFNSLSKWKFKEIYIDYRR